MRPFVSTIVSASKHQEPEILLVRAQEGDTLSREALIKKFTPFIMRVTSQTSGRYVRLGSDDEASIALIAFDEAITSYRNEKCVSFLSFAETVIRRRLIDYFRKATRSQKEIPLSSFEYDSEDESGEDTANRMEVRQAKEAYQIENESTDRRDEIIHYNRLLQEYGISFSELVDLAPKHEDARCRAIQVAKMIADNPQYREYLKLKGSLPLKELERDVDVSRKTLERQRKYIIAVTVIFMENLEHLKGYIDKE
ncbi:RNA polymerase sigma factor SigI [Heliobacterium chlorum]|uniref:RNA polymerase sigma factor SigI n=1 Tax=Heliobacterium chlorum TaxID=2698 RepID=A0ABR7T6S8_HELCL|nr:RNA polymerase sigma factor SigI [Heliobacterium chlorum]MBC9785665.1 RNA polymerase sigma factor SigI [Heliobacterium chlorum]